jgi:hypothetical protein
LPDKVRGAVEGILVGSIQTYPSANKKDVARVQVVADGMNWCRQRVSVPVACRLLWRPLKLLVENRRNDAAFLLRMAEPNHRRKLELAIEKGWVEFEMGGGLQEIQNRLEDLSTSASDAQIIELARLWVMFDRDADPKDRSRESNASRIVREIAEQTTKPWPLAAHQLSRRAIENYVPPATLRSWWCSQADGNKGVIKRTRRVEAFLSPVAQGGLRDESRHQFNMKGGLLNDLRFEARQQVGSGQCPLLDEDLDPLFRGLSQENREALLNGFPRLADAFNARGAVEEQAFSRGVPSEERRRLLESLLSRM